MSDDFELLIVSSDKEYSQAMDIRRKVFVKEYKIPENKEFDGNDHSATHVMARQNGCPAGTMRIRYFNGFVKFERMCVLPDYRKTDVSEKIMRKGMQFCAEKGYEKVYGICKKELLNRWKQDGFSQIPGAPSVEQNGMTLIPVYCRLPASDFVLTMETSAMVLNAREGDWRSMVRQLQKENAMSRNGRSLSAETAKNSPDYKLWRNFNNGIGSLSDRVRMLKGLKDHKETLKPLHNLRQKNGRDY